MFNSRRSWQEELAIIDRLMKTVSSITDPEEMVRTYWAGVGELMPGEEDYLAISRRGVEPPWYLITRSSRFTERLNPWLQRDKLPRLRGGILGEIAYANQPVIIEDLPARLSKDDPAWLYLNGFQSLVALPQYDAGQGLNVSMELIKPGRELDRSSIPMTHWQAGLFGRGTQNLVLRNQLEKALAALDRELHAVGEIQRSLLPGSLPEIPGFALAAYYETSARAGGDYYDFFPLGDGANGEGTGGWGMIIADVSGHGTPAAVLMAVTHAIAHTRPGTAIPPGAVLSHLNHHLTRSYTASGAFVTAFYAALDPATRLLTYATAGHNPPRLVRDGRVISLNHRGALPLGIVGDEAFGDSTIKLQTGDLLLLYTDGITEAMAPTNESGTRELFGTERLDRLLLECASVEPNVCLERVLAAIAEFSNGTPATDDRTLIALRCL